MSLWKGPAVAVAIVSALWLALASTDCAGSPAAKEISNLQYRADLKGCIDHTANKDECDLCIAKVQQTWDSAGAPPAAKLDGGSQ